MNVPLGLPSTGIVCFEVISRTSPAWPPSTSSPAMVLTVMPAWDSAWLIESDPVPMGTGTVWPLGCTPSRSMVTGWSPTFAPWIRSSVLVTGLAAPGS